MEEKTVILHKGKRGMTNYGHPWVYRSQIGSVSEDSPGEIYSVRSANGRFVGKGYYNPRSEIVVRLFTHKDEPIDERFFERRIKKALDFRAKYIKDTDSYRVIFSEADGIPGLIADKYGSCLVFQVMTLGIEKRKGLIADILKKILKPEFIYEKSDAPSRRLEGLEEAKGWLGKSGPREVEIRESGVRFFVDIEEGHKTGFYLDQRDSRLSVRDFAKGRRALDCFCYTGGFSINAGLNGVKSVLGIDVHKGQIELAKRNVELNGLSGKGINFRSENVFEALKNFDKAKEKFDLVMLDPPSFVKNKESVEGALTGYKEINLRAMKILSEGGVLFTFSCSGHIDEELFLQVVLDAAFDAKRSVKLLRRLYQPPDHPVDPFIPQTSYLKGLVLEIA